MPPGSNSDRLLEIKSEIESFLRQQPDALMLEAGEEIIDLSSAECRVSIEYGKLLLEAWDGSRSLVRRIEDIACRDQNQLGLFVRKPGGRETIVLNLCASQSAAAGSPQDARHALRRDLTAYLRKHFPEYHLERVSNRSDRARSFSAWHTRGVARRGRSAWAFIGLGASEPFAAADAALAYGLNWLDWVREKSENCAISGLKLFLPHDAIPLTALRASQLDRSLNIEIFAWPSTGAPEPLKSGEFINAATRLTPRRDATQWMARHHDFLRGIFGESLDRVDLVPGAAANTLSFRARGLEIARMEGQVAPRFYWGIEGNTRTYEPSSHEDFKNFLDHVFTKRDAKNKDTTHEIYRLQPERWLESLLVNDLSKLDPALRAEPVYSQVPAFAGADRGVVDILGISKEGRLAVVELKLHEEITLPLQGLDYWLRVKWLNDRGEFGKHGYFPGLEISPAPPLLYLVSPAFRFHPANEKIIRYFDHSVEVMMVGINQQWRNGIKALFRKQMKCKG
ncbi:MAG TPA: hypothetical protein VGX94_16050 [Terriglobia bacterium]|nr:hypothetical protein [Terriglobia bacterium]